MILENNLFCGVSYLKLIYLRLIFSNKKSIKSIYNFSVGIKLIKSILWKLINNSLYFKNQIWTIWNQRDRSNSLFLFIYFPSYWKRLLMKWKGWSVERQVPLPIFHYRTRMYFSVLWFVWHITKWNIVSEIRQYRVVSIISSDDSCAWMAHGILI